MVNLSKCLFCFHKATHFYTKRVSQNLFASNIYCRCKDHTEPTDYWTKEITYEEAVAWQVMKT